MSWRNAQEMNVHFQSRRFTKVTQLLTGTQVTEQLGINPFAQELFPIITRYFGQEADEAPDDIIDRGYVSTEERSEYGAVLETYLKDRARVVAAKRCSARLADQISVSGRHMLWAEGCDMALPLLCCGMAHTLDVPSSCDFQAVI
jgi:hypothetical protein